MQHQGIGVELKKIPLKCRAPKDLPVLATAIDGKAKIIVSGDSNLRADNELRAGIETYDIQLLGVDSFLKLLDEESV
ncbi:MAG: hypothetical protein SFW36_14230 [Leptolyngbyaceae cyanobacterium bins.59]|nr:hypothetical protein [Leptolyngbyaceae cyanobacterium bins.59]